MAKDKPFRTIEEQVELLESRGMRMDEDPRPTLMREGYYSVVNGYKDILIDRDATARAGDDRFLPGTTFRLIRILFDADRILREDTFHALVRAETTMRNAVVYAFCDANREPDAYLDPTRYCGASEYHAPQRYNDNLIRLLGVLKSAHDDEWGQECVGHYLSEYGHVPLWVLANTLTFGNLSHFYSMQRRSVKNETCRIVSSEQGVGRIKVERLGSVFSTLVDFRNICAHDDRLYCARTGKRHDRRFSDMMRAMSVVVDPETMERFSSDVRGFIDLFGPMPDIQEKVVSEMRVSVSGNSVSPAGGRR
ncbi:MAG: Abi family protein [Atopobiaceae bacterium]|nr:Abi family protein [Atopobiaceae bacterium]